MSKSRPPLAGITRKHLARAERESLMQKWIVGLTIGVTVLVVGLLTYGWLDQNVIQLRRPAVKVAGVEVSIEKFQKKVRYDRFQAIKQYFQIAQYVQFAQAFGADEQTISSYQQQAQQIQQQLDQPETFGKQSLNSLIEDEIIRQEAAKRGISVSAEEVDRAMEEAFGYYVNGTPTPPPTATLPPTSTTPTVTPSPSPSPTATATGAPTEPPTPTLAPTATEAPTEAPTQGPSPTPQPSATPYTFEGFQKQKGDFLAEIAKTTNLTEADIRAIFEANLLRKKLQEIIGSDVTKDVPTAHVRHILIQVDNSTQPTPTPAAEVTPTGTPATPAPSAAELAAKATAEAVIKQLQSGASFDELAKKYSADPGSKDKGGDLGTVDKGTFVAEFEDVVFNPDTPLGLYAQPVKTQFGYHIIQIVERGKRPLTADEITQAQSKAFSDWLAEQRKPTDFVQEGAWQAYTPAHPTIDDVINAQPTPTTGPTTPAPENTATVSASATAAATATP